MSTLYHKLSQAGIIRNSYLRRFLIVAFMGLHVPLLVVLFLVGFNLVEPTDLTLILGILVATLVATGVTLYVVKELMWPLRQGTDALRKYFETGELPELSVSGTKNEAGQLLQMIDASIRKAHQSSEDQKFLLTLLSHDLRSPAAQTVTAARYIQDESNVELIHQLARLMERSGQQMLEQMTNLVTMLRTDEDAVQTELVNIGTVLAMAVEQAQSIGGVKGVPVRFENRVQGKPSIIGQTMLVQQAIYNLLTNAVKFSEAGQEVVVDASLEGFFCKILVRDQGLGFDPAKAERLFDRFTKESRKGTDGEASSGIGLHLIRKIATRFGGRVEARSEGPGKGAEFHLWLPIGTKDEVAQLS